MLIEEQKLEKEIMGLVTINGIEYNKSIIGDKICYTTISKEFKIEEKVEKMASKGYSYDCIIHKIEEGKGRTERWLGQYFASTNYDQYAMNMARYECVKRAKISLQDFSHALGVIVNPFESNSLPTYLKVVENISSSHNNSRGYHGSTSISSEIIKVTLELNGELSEKSLSYQSELLSNGQKKREIDEYDDKIDKSLQLLRFAGIVKTGISLYEFKNAIHGRKSLRNPDHRKYFIIADGIYGDFKCVESIGRVNTASCTGPAIPKSVVVTNITQTPQVEQIAQSIPATTIVNTNNSSVIPPKVISPTEDITFWDLVQYIFKELIKGNKVLFVLLLVLMGSVSYCSGYVLSDKYLNKSQTAPRATPQKSN